MGVYVKYHFDGHEVTLEELRTLLTDPMLQARLDRLLEILTAELGEVLPAFEQEFHHVLVALTDGGQLKVDTNNCNQEFAKTTTSSLQATLKKTAYFSPGMRLMLRVQGANEPLIYHLDEVRLLVMGRSDAEADGKLDVDLRRFHAAERGVSRRHAAITWRSGALHIVDMGSSNGTFLNGQRIGHNQPAVLHTGDSLRLGALVMEFRLVSPDELV